MKKQLLTLAVAALTTGAVISSGCGSKNKGTSNPLVGSWEARHVSVVETDVSSNPPTVVFQLDSTYAPNQGDYIEFHANNTYLTRNYASSPTATDSGNYQYASNRLTITSTSPTGGGSTSRISFSGNTFTLMVDTTEMNDHIVGNVTYNRR